MTPDTSKRVKGKTTFRIAAVLYMLSALLELLGIASGALLFGALHGGGVAIAYHGVYAALFIALGLGLWRGAAWGYRLVFAATLLYSLDKIQSLLYPEALLAQMLDSLGPHRELGRALDPHLLFNVFAGLTAVFVLCWWGFAGYTYVRRSYFKTAGASKDRL